MEIHLFSPPLLTEYTTHVFSFRPLFFLLRNPVPLYYLLSPCVLQFQLQVGPINFFLLWCSFIVYSSRTSPLQMCSSMSCSSVPAKNHTSTFLHIHSLLLSLSWGVLPLSGSCPLTCYVTPSCVSPAAVYGRFTSDPSSSLALKLCSPTERDHRYTHRPTVPFILRILQTKCCVGM